MEVTWDPVHSFIVFLFRQEQSLIGKHNQKSPKQKVVAKADSKTCSQRCEILTDQTSEM